MADTRLAHQSIDLFSLIPPEILFNVFDKEARQIRPITLQVFALTCKRNAEISRLYFAERKIPPLGPRLLLDEIAWNDMLELMKYGSDTISIHDYTMMAAVMNGSLKCFVFCHKKTRNSEIHRLIKKAGIKIVALDPLI